MDAMIIRKTNSDDTRTSFVLKFALPSLTSLIPSELQEVNAFASSRPKSLKTAINRRFFSWSPVESRTQLGRDEIIRKEITSITPKEFKE